jgi:hypothetical protein
VQLQDAGRIYLSMMRQQVITSVNEPELHFLVNHFAERVKTLAPVAMLIDDDDPIIYSMSSPARLVISEGSLHQLSNEEFERRILKELENLGSNLASSSVN